jgi:hypothetical protein
VRGRQSVSMTTMVNCSSLTPIYILFQLWHELFFLIMRFCNW